jgi:polyisoprenoid-binding protein YceI
MKRIASIGVVVLALSQAVMSAPLTFDFKDPKGVNNVVFKLDAPLESITGSAGGISGTVTFDPEQPGAIAGKLVVSTASLELPNPMMKQHLRGAMWLDAAKYPAITFEAKALTNVKTEGHKTSAEVTGSLTIKDVTKELTVPVTLTFLKDKLGQRVPNQQGDLLVIRAAFTIKRSEYDINPKAPEDKVANEINLTLSLAGAAPRN